MRSLIIVLTLAVSSQAAAEAPDISVPPGFRIDVIASVPNARSLAWGNDGTLFVGAMRGGKVHAVRNALSAEPTVTVVDEKLRLPNGVAFRDGDLYVAEANRLLVYRDIGARLDNPGEPEVLADLPGGKQHQWKYIAFGPDGQLYVPVGAPCNVCDAPGYGLILSMNPDGSDQQVYARGIRNSVGFDWHPATGEFWFTDNNRDMMGDDMPPGELNRAAAAGQHFGFPFCHGTSIVEPDEELAALGRCGDSVPPAQELGAHVAALGIAFYDGIMFPDAYRNQVFIAEHGSWNRTEKIGYRVTLVQLDETGTKATGYQVFAEGWLDGDEVLGRPVDVLTAPDGSLLLSDDRGGRIYRISYAGS